MISVLRGWDSARCEPREMAFGASLQRRMDTFRGGAPCHLKEIRQFRSGAQIRDWCTRVGIIEPLHQLIWVQFCDEKRTKMNVITGRQIVLAARPKGKPQLSDFRLEEVRIPTPG